MASPAFGADRVPGTWTTEGPEPRTFTFQASGERFAGIVCGPCNGPTSVFRIDDGILDPQPAGIDRDVAVSHRPRLRSVCSMTRSTFPPRIFVISRPE